MRGQGRIYQRGSAWWIAYYHRGAQIRESVQKATNKNTKTAAEGLLKQRLRTAGTPEFIGPAAERLTVEELGIFPRLLAPSRPSRCLLSGRTLRDATRADARGASRIAARRGCRAPAGTRRR